MQPIKTLRAELKIELSDAKTLLAELPACVALMREACASLEAAGMTAERVSA